MFTISMSFQFRSVVEVFIANFAEVQTVIAMLMFMFFQMLFWFHGEVTLITLKFFPIMLFDVHSEFPLAAEPFPTILHHALECRVFSMYNFMSFEFAFKVCSVITIFTFITLLLMVIHVSYKTRC